MSRRSAGVWIRRTAGISLKYAIDGHAAAPMMLTIAGCLVLVLVVGVPLAIRRGRLQRAFAVGVSGPSAASVWAVVAFGRLMAWRY
ncbi:hypothetical protein, partial [Actinoplanes italicus]|uniref:hypothetical protein n=1 Tax=Actinoplanes italicus TaxID=113567 RepID=UPI001944D2A9